MSRDVAQLRIPPNSVEAERAVLGSVLLDNRTWDVVSDVLDEADFYRTEHRTVFAAIATLCNGGKSADVITVFEHLDRAGKAEEAGGLAYLSSCTQEVISVSGVRRYAEIVRDNAVLRRLITVADQIATRAFSPDGRTVEGVVDEAEAKILAIAESRSSDDDFKPMATYAGQAIERINRIAENPDEASDFIPTGIGAWDELMDGGMRGGEVHVVAARPGHGKSAKLLTVAANVLRYRRAGKPVGDVGIYSMEMPGLQWANRAIAQLGRVHLSKIKRPERLRQEDWPGVTDAVDLLQHMGLHINDRSALTINNVRASARRLARRTKLALLGVDYLGLMAGMDPSMSRAYQIEEITKGLKNLAKELNVPIMLLVQLKRAVDARVNDLPTLADLRDSGAIEQDADTITFIHRPHKASPDLSEEWKPYARGYVAKARESEGGLFDMHYDGPRLQFCDWPTDVPIPTDRTRVARSAAAKPYTEDV